MKINDISGEVVDVFDITGEDLQFSGSWKKTYEAIELSLADFEDELEKERILNKIAGIINVLVRFGRTYENIVVETAELFVFSKEAGLDSNIFEKTYGKYISDGVACLNQSLDSDEKRKSIFENQDLKYLAKIKIAEYIVDLLANSSVSKELLLEIDDVIKNYNQSAYGGLMNMLIEERNKRK